MNDVFVEYIHAILLHISRGRIFDSMSAGTPFEINTVKP